MAEPTVSAFQQSVFTDLLGTETTPSISWAAGDYILVVGMTEDSGATLGTPTATGLTFSLITSVSGASNTFVYLWSALAAGSGSSAVASSHGGTNKMGGIAAFVFTACTGFGTAQTITNSGNRVISVTRAQANSHVVAVFGDWSANTDVALTATPTGTIRLATNQSGRATAVVCSFGDQGATGTASYGYTDQTGTVDNNGIAIEVKGVAAGAPTVKTLAALGVG